MNWIHIKMEEYLDLKEHRGAELTFWRIASLLEFCGLLVLLTYLIVTLPILWTAL